MHKYREVASEIKLQPAVQPGQREAPRNSMRAFTQLLGQALQGLSSALKLSLLTNSKLAQHVLSMCSRSLQSSTGQTQPCKCNGLMKYAFRAALVSVIPGTKMFLGSPVLGL